MDDELLQFEAELKRLRPIVPSRELAVRIERDLAAPTPAQHAAVPVRWLWAVALPVAVATAAAIVVVRVSNQPITPASQTSASLAAARGTTSSQAKAAAGDTPTPFKPIAAQNVLVSASDEGFVTLGDGTQARRERLHYVDIITWKNPRTNASLTWSVPREEVRVVPVVFQ